MTSSAPDLYPTQTGRPPSSMDLAKNHTSTTSRYLGDFGADTWATAPKVSSMDKGSPKFVKVVADIRNWLVNQ